MSTANWITDPTLPAYAENYNFNLAPLVLQFDADAGATVQLINGAWPPGLRWSVQDQTVVIEGVSTGVALSTEYGATLRITDPDRTVADRTFYITITAVGVAPSWQNQSTDLGYATIGTTNQFTVAATMSNSTVIAYRILAAPTGCTINSATGVIAYTPPTSMIPSAQSAAYAVEVPMTIRATSNAVYTDLVVKVTAMQNTHAPAWLTAPGQIGTWTMGTWVEFALQAWAPAGAAITYSWVSAPTVGNFTLTSTGFLWGQVPIAAVDTAITFTVAAATAQGITARTFNVLAVQDTASGLLTWQGSNHLGTVQDGAVYTLDVSAASSRPGSTVYHQFVGGSLPYGMTLNSSQGVIAGFLEYHAQQRSYWFDILAWDGVQRIQRKYSLTVTSSCPAQFVSAQLPVQSITLAAVVEARRALFENTSSILNSNTLKDTAAVAVNLISGLSSTNGSVDTVFAQANLYMHSTTLGFGAIHTANVLPTGTLYYSSIQDPLDHSAYVIQTTGMQTIYPQSLDNMRTALSSAGYANAGAGSGAILLPIINYNTTAIHSVEIIAAGTGYQFAPKLAVEGTGTGAVLSATLGVHSVSIATAGYDWTLGETAVLRINSQQVVTLRVTAVNSQGGIQSMAVVDTAQFTQFPALRKTIINSQGVAAEIVCALGIHTVTVVQGGAGYADTGTTISSSGSELLPQWQTVYSPVLPIDTATAQGNAQVSSNNTTVVQSILTSSTWLVQHLTLTAQGKTWTGNTQFDHDICSFDGGSSRFVEWVEPENTVFDSSDTQFDVSGTRFDSNAQFAPTAYAQWGSTIWDSESTVFDLYRTAFDSAGPSNTSITAVRKLYRLVSPQISGNNTVA